MQAFLNLNQIYRFLKYLVKNIRNAMLLYQLQCFIENSLQNIGFLIQKKKNHIY